MHKNVVHCTQLLLVAAIWLAVTTPANACYRELTRDALMHRFHYEIERQLTVNLNDSGLAGIGHPKFTTLRPVEDDCRGLNFSFYITKYRFTIDYDGTVCEHDGVIILKGTAPNAPIEIQDEKRCPTDITSWSGLWINQDDQGALKRIMIDVDNQTVAVFANCGGGECDWGRRRFAMQNSGETMVVTFQQSNGVATLFIRNLSGRLQILYVKRYDDAAGGHETELTETFSRHP